MDRPFLPLPRAHNQQRHAAEGLALVGLKRFHGGGVSVVHGGDPAGAPTHTIDQPEVHDAIAALRRFVDRYGHDLVLIGEAYLPIDPLMAYYGEALDGFHLPFN